MPEPVVRFFDRFSVSTAYGHASMYSPWVRVPEHCQHVEFLAECHAFNNGSIEVAFETSMDQTSTVEMWADVLDAVEVLQYARSESIGRYMRVRLTSLTSPEQPNMVLSAIALFRTAA